MRYFLALLTCFLLTVTAFGQSLVPIYFPTHMQGNGSGGDRMPYVSRFTVKDLRANATYRYVNHFVTLPTDSYGSGVSIFIRPNGDFERVEFPDFYDPAICGEFTTDAAGSYTGWFVNEPDGSFAFTPGQTVYFRLTLNDGNGGGWFDSYITSQESINVINFSNAADGGTAIRSTPATDGIAKNFVFFYGSTNPAPGEAPVMGTLIESDGIDNSTSNNYAAFYSNDVNAVNKAWGGIIPNNLANGIKRIAQYSIADGTEVGYKTSANGSWAQAGGGVVSTVNTSGGTGNVIVLDGNVITLGMPVALPQTINFNTLAAKTYGATDFDPGATASSLLPVTYTSSNPAVATIVNNNTIHITGAGTTDITAVQAGNADYLAATPVVQTLTVNKAMLTVTAEDKVKVQGDPLPLFTVTYAGFVNNEGVAVLTTAPTGSTTADANSPAGEYAITAGGGAAANYNFTYIAGKLTVTAAKQAQTIAFGPLAAKTYGAAEFDPGATISSGLPIVYSSSDPSVAVIVNGKIQIKGIGTVNITAAHPGNANYEPATDVMQSLTINKGLLTIKAENKTRLIGQANPVLTILYTGFAYNETSSVLTTQPVIATAATAASPVGNYPITVTGATAANYTISQVEGVLTVEPLPSQVITFTALPASRYGDGNIMAGATASSGLPVAYVSSNTQVATVQGNGTIIIVGAGVTNITASQPGDASHAAAQDVARTLTVQKANLQIRALDTAKLEGQANPPLQILYSGFVKNEDATALTGQPVVSTIATTNSIAGRYTISVSGATSSNYNIAQVGGILKVLPALGEGQDNMTAWMSGPGQLQVNIYSVKPGKATIQLFDQQGTRVLQTVYTLVAGYNTPRLLVGNLVAGIYHVRVYGPEFILKHKLVIR
jgi:hypothetical protein